MGDSPSDEPIPAAENPEDPIDPPPEHVQQKTAQFAEGILERMGYPSTVKYKGQDGAKIFLEITTEFSNIIIGKRGKNLDALQLLVNVYLVRIVGEAVPWRIILDLEGYRTRQEKALVRTAHRVADEVLRTGSSQLLEPMNPFERRLVHTAISTRKNLVTRSDGEGLYKRIEIISDRGDRARSRRRR